MIYVDLVFPGWLSAAGRLVRLMGFPSVRGFERFADQAGLAKQYQARSAMRLCAIYRKPEATASGSSA